MKPLFEKKSEKIALADLPKAEELSKELGKIKYRERYMRTLRSTVFTLVTVAALAVLVATIWLPVLQIYGNSMTPTLKAGDMVVSVSKKNLKQGDVVAFYYNNKVLVKRVIATSGQWVNIDKSGSTLTKKVMSLLMGKRLMSLTYKAVKKIMEKPISSYLIKYQMESTL